MSIHKLRDGVYKVRWREGARNRSVTVHGSHELAKKILYKKLAIRAENRHLDVKKEINCRMSTLIDRYREQYGNRKKSANREKSILDGIRAVLGDLFVREVDGVAVERWFRLLTAKQKLSPRTAVRHFNVMHHMMEKAATIWSTETGIDKNPSDLVEIKRSDDQRDRYLSAEEIRRLKCTLDDVVGQVHKSHTADFRRLRVVVLIALSTGMRIGEIFSLSWDDVLYDTELIAVRSKLKGGEFRYVPLAPELAEELRSYPKITGNSRIFPPVAGAKTFRLRVDRSFRSVLTAAKIKNFRFHDLRHTFASWYMMNGGDLYELAKILGHSNIKMTERYAKLSKGHIARTGNTARAIWRMMGGNQT